MVEKLYKIDQIFGNCGSSSHFNKPEKFAWVAYNNDSDTVFLTDHNLTDVDRLGGKKVFAWIIESPAVTPQAIAYIKDNYHKFVKVYTSCKELLTLSDKFDFVPVGACWIDAAEDRQIHPKSKHVSIIASYKNWLPGHALRHQAIAHFGSLADVYGSCRQPLDNKADGLRDYRFSIAIENCRAEYYFSEKLIDCFITGTIPIYWGCPSIDKFFDMRGILPFADLDELGKILAGLTAEAYADRLDCVRQNFELARQYLVTDNILYEKFCAWRQQSR